MDDSGLFDNKDAGRIGGRLAHPEGEIEIEFGEEFYELNFREGISGKAEGEREAETGDGPFFHSHNGRCNTTKSSKQRGAGLGEGRDLFEDKGRGFAACGRGADGDGDFAGFDAPLAV